MNWRGIPNRSDIAVQLGACLRAVGYDAEAIRESLGGTGGFARDEDLAIKRRRASGSDPRTSLIRLFYLGERVTCEAVAAALPSLPLASLQRAELLHLEDAMVRPLVRIVPARGLLLAGDAYTPAHVGRDYVSALSASSRLLASITLRQTVPTVLDLGCGSGVHALFAARHAETVTAVDVNPRALAFTQFNAHLNGIDNIAVSHSDWLAQLGQRQFDLIVCNPPFVISPDDTLLFRDSGFPGDSLCRTLIREIPRYLKDEGFAQILCNWSHHGEQTWWESIASWFEDIGCEAWVFHLRTDDPLTYAGQWNDELRQSDPAAFERVLDHWLSFYREAGITAISLGAVVLRRRMKAPPWTRMASVTLDPDAAAGDHVLRVFDVQRDGSRFAADGLLLKEHLRPAGNHRINQELIFRDGTYELAQPVMRSLSGLGLEAPIDVTTLQVLLRLDPSVSLGTTLHEVGRALGVSPATMNEHVLPAIRRLLELGLLTPSAPH